MLVEVSSSASLDICKVVMNEFVREVLKMSPGLCIDQVSELASHWVTVDL